MAKKKTNKALADRALKDAQNAERNKQIKTIVRSMDTSTRHSVECFVCGEQDDTVDQSEKEYAIDLLALGWHYGVSEKFQTEGVMCPTCAEAPDAERGEDLD